MSALRASSHHFLALIRFSALIAHEDPVQKSSTAEEVCAFDSRRSAVCPTRMWQPLETSATRHERLFAWDVRDWCHCQTCRPPACTTALKILCLLTAPARLALAGKADMASGGRELMPAGAGCSVWVLHRSREACWAMRRAMRRSEARAVMTSISVWSCHMLREVGFASLVVM